MTRGIFYRDRIYRAWLGQSGQQEVAEPVRTSRGGAGHRGTDQDGMGQFAGQRLQARGDGHCLAQYGVRSSGGRSK